MEGGLLPEIDRGFSFQKTAEQYGSTGPIEASQSQHDAARFEHDLLRLSQNPRGFGGWIGAGLLIDDFAVNLRIHTGAAGIEDAFRTQDLNEVPAAVPIHILVAFDTTAATRTSAVHRYVEGFRFLGQNGNGVAVADSDGPHRIGFFRVQSTRRVTGMSKGHNIPPRLVKAVGQGFSLCSRNPQRALD